MNRIYKVIWSRTRNCYAAVSEFARGRGKPSSSGRKKVLSAALAALMLTGGGTGISMAAAADDVSIGANTAQGSGATVSGVTNNHTGQIAIGKNAHVRVNTNGQEGMIGIGGSRTNVAGGIAIGSNTYARPGSIMIGSHVYQGSMGDVEGINTTERYSGTQSGFNTTETGAYGHTVATTTIGTNSFTKGFLATTLGDYNIQSGRISSMNGLSSLSYGAQNFGATVIGALNSNESASAPEASILSPSYSGVANSIIGIANQVNNSNGTLVFGAGNTVRNSIGTTGLSGLSPTSALSLQDAVGAANTVRTAIRNSDGGGATVVIGGNDVSDTRHTMVTALNSTVSNSNYSLLDAYHSTMSNADNVYAIGMNNIISGTTDNHVSHTTLIGDNRTVGENGSNSVIIGSADSTMTTNNSNVTVLGHNANATVDGGVALGSGSIASRASGVAGYDPAANAASRSTDRAWRSTAGAVSVGNDTATRQITNVAAGSEDTDAVNVAQLKSVDQNLHNLDNRVNGLDSRVSSLGSRINKVGAGAAALAALHPLDFDPGDKWNFAVGYGNYRNANSVAVGAFYRPNANTMFSVGTSFGNGENMFNAGASFKFGKGSSYSGISKAELAAENEQLKKNDALQDQKIQKQDQEIQELKQQLADLAGRIK